MTTPPSLNSQAVDDVPESRSVLKRFHELAPVIVVVAAAVFSVVLHSWMILWASVGFMLANEILFASLARLASPKDHPLTFADLRGVDRIIAATAGVSLALFLIGSAERYYWSNSGVPMGLQIQSDYRSGSMTEDQYRLFAWECESKFGRGPIEVKVSGEDSYARCGGVWPNTITLAAKTAQFEKAWRVHRKNPDAPISITANN